MRVASFILAVCAVFALAQTPAQATHFRGGWIEWSQDANDPTQITVNSNSTWRASWFGCSSYVVGQELCANSPSIKTHVFDESVRDNNVGLFTTLSTKLVERYDAVADTVFLSNTFVGNTADLVNSPVSDIAFQIGACCRQSTLQTVNKDNPYAVVSTVPMDGISRSSPTLFRADGEALSTGTVSTNDFADGALLAALPSRFIVEAGRTNTFSTGIVLPDWGNWTLSLNAMGFYTTPMCGINNGVNCLTRGTSGLELIASGLSIDSLGNIIWAGLGNLGFYAAQVQAVDAITGTIFSYDFIIEQVAAGTDVSSFYVTAENFLEEVTGVPAPLAGVLLLFGMGGLMTLRRRRTF